MEVPNTLAYYDTATITAVNVLQYRAQCYETFYVYDLRVKARVFIPGKPFQPSLMFVGKAKSLP